MILDIKQADRNILVFTRIFLENKFYSAIALVTAILIQFINNFRFDDQELLFLSALLLSISIISFLLSGQKEFLFDKNSGEIKVNIIRRIYKKSRIYYWSNLSHISCDVKGYIQTKSSFSKFAYFLVMKDGARILLSIIPPLFLVKWKKTEHPEAIEKLAQFLQLEIKKKRILS